MQAASHSGGWLGRRLRDGPRVALREGRRGQQRAERGDDAERRTKLRVTIAFHACLS
jgi:hypothetical protein